jgi:hypothetical protein
VLLVGVVFLKTWMYPRLDSTYSARYVWHRIQAGESQACVGEISRTWIYGLNFYSGTPLPPCSSGQYRVRLVPGEARRPVIIY